VKLLSDYLNVGPKWSRSTNVTDGSDEQTDDILKAIPLYAHTCIVSSHGKNYDHWSGTWWHLSRIGALRSDFVRCFT